MFAILLYCKRFTAINYSLNLTFFYKFSAILLDCSLFLSGRTGCPEPRPEPDPNISPDWPEPDPNTEQLLPVLITAGTADVNLVSRRYWLEGRHYLHPEQLLGKAPTRRPDSAWVSWAARRKANNYLVTASLQVWAHQLGILKANNYYQFWRLQDWARVRL